MKSKKKKKTEKKKTKKKQVRKSKANGRQETEWTLSSRSEIDESESDVEPTPLDSIASVWARLNIVRNGVRSTSDRKEERLKIYDRVECAII